MRLGAARVGACARGRGTANGPAVVVVDVLAPSGPVTVTGTLAFALVKALLLPVVLKMDTVALAVVASLIDIAVRVPSEVLKALTITSVVNGVSWFENDPLYCSVAPKAVPIDTRSAAATVTASDAVPSNRVREVFMFCLRVLTSLERQGSTFDCVVSNRHAIA